MTIDLLDQAISIHAGESVTAELLGVEISLRRDFTGAEVQEIINGHFDYPEDSMEDQLVRILGIVSDSEDDIKLEFAQKAVELRLAVFQRVLVEIGKICGYRGEDGSFLPMH